jgi:hypothetical protein
LGPATLKSTERCLFLSYRSGYQTATELLLVGNESTTMQPRRRSGLVTATDNLHVNPEASMPTATAIDELKFRSDKSTPSSGVQLVLAFDHPSQEFLQSMPAYQKAAEIAAQYGFGGANTKDTETALVDKTTDEPVVQFDPSKPTDSYIWRGWFTFIKPR